MASPKPQRKIPGLYQRNGVWYLRVMVPDALKDQPPYNGNRLRCNVSLKTRDPEAARVEALSLRAEYEAEFLRAKDALRVPRVSEIPKALAEYIVARARHIILATDDVLRFTPDAARSLLAAIDLPQRFFTTSNDPEVVPEWLQATEDGSLSEATLERLQVLQASALSGRKGELARGQLKPVETVCGGIAAELGITVDWAAPSARAVLIDVLRATVSAWGDTVRRGAGEPVETPEAPSAPATDADGSREVKEKELKDVLQDWITTKRPSDDSISKTELALRLWDESKCAVSLTKVNRKDGHNFRLWLLDPERKWGDKTAANRLNALKALLTVAVDAGYIDANPWSTLSITVKDAETRYPFTHAEVKRLFAGPIYERGELPANQRAAGWAAYWLPLLGLYTGARLGELGQLAPSDVLGVNGVHAVSIHDRAEGSRVKTEASERLVPIHPELIRLGFLNFVDDAKAAGHTHLFPGLNKTTKGPADVFGRWFRLRLDAVEITDSLKTFHAFRHTLASELTAANVVPDLADSITGHALQGSTRSKAYTHVGLPAMAEALEKVRYPLDLQRVYKKN